MYYKELLSIYLKELQFLYNPDEIRAIFYRLTHFYYQVTRLDISLNPELETPGNHLIEALQELKNGKPWQYITGKTEFYGLPFYVGFHTLIPRPETEELVDWIIKDTKNQTGIKILDIGTGSGAIAISLAKNLPQTRLTALDISIDALEIAKKNAIYNNVTITFLEKDILETEHCSKHYDIIVSNPPYVRKSEKKIMHPNVLKYEPETALFVPDEEALIFYKKILNIALNNKTQKIYLEINEFLKTDLESLLIQLNITKFVFKKDLFDKWRMLRVCL